MVKITYASSSIQTTPIGEMGLSTAWLTIRGVVTPMIASTTRPYTRKTRTPGGMLRTCCSIGSDSAMQPGSGHRTARLYSADVADFPLKVSDPAVLADLERAIDQEAKIPRALEALGPVAGQRVVLLDRDRGVRAGQLRDMGGRVSAVPSLSTAGLPRGLADAVVSFWAGFRGGSPDTEAQITDAERVLRPGGRLLIVHDYGRDDVSLLLDDQAAHGEQVAWSRRDGWFLLHDFKVRVLHCWWTFDSLEQAHDLLVAGFASAGTAVAQRMRRPRLSYKVAIYHRTLGETG